MTDSTPTKRVVLRLLIPRLLINLMVVTHFRLTSGCARFERCVSLSARRQVFGQAQSIVPGAPTNVQFIYGQGLKKVCRDRRLGLRSFQPRWQTCGCGVHETLLSVPRAVGPRSCFHAVRTLMDPSGLGMPSRHALRLQVSSSDRGSAADIILDGTAQRSFPELDFALSGLAGSIETTS